MAELTLIPVIQGTMIVCCGVSGEGTLTCKIYVPTVPVLMVPDVRRLTVPDAGGVSESAP